jgi:hypothetical protein
MIKLFNVKKVENELQSINDNNQIETKAAIQLITNNLELYNSLVRDFKNGDSKKVYILYQLNGQIFKQLKEFGILPSDKKNNLIEKKSFFEENFDD